MTNEERIKKLNTFELAEFIYNVSNGCEKITVCNNECAKCEYSDSWCISNIAEYLMQEADK